MVYLMLSPAALGLNNIWLKSRNALWNLLHHPQQRLSVCNNWFLSNLKLQKSINKQVLTGWHWLDINSVHGLKNQPCKPLTDQDSKDGQNDMCYKSVQSMWSHTWKLIWKAKGRDRFASTSAAINVDPSVQSTTIILYSIPTVSARTAKATCMPSGNNMVLRFESLITAWPSSLAPESLQAFAKHVQSHTEIKRGKL